MHEKICKICSTNYTTISTDIPTSDDKGYQYFEKLYVCQECLDQSKTHFVYFCNGCGASYFRLKEEVMRICTDDSLFEALEKTKDIQMIIGIDMCITCKPEEFYENIGNA